MYSLKKVTRLFVYALLYGNYYELQALLYYFIISSIQSLEYSGKIPLFF